jgi:gliding motility-associated-like protein
MLLMLWSFATRANHLLGGEINYKFISTSGNTSVYRVTLSLYADCSSNIAGGAYQALPGATPQIVIYKGNNAIDNEYLGYVDSLSDIEITPVCPDEKNNTACTNITNPIPGVKKYVYSANISLNGTDSNWRFAFEGVVSIQPLPTSAGRSLIIQNAQIVDPNSGTATVMYLEATLNNTLGYNNSTTFLSPPTPFFCLNKAADYSLGAADADNDSLNFTLIPGKSSNNNPSFPYTDVVYLAPYTAQNPLPTQGGGFNFSNINGQMSFTPNLVLNCLVTNLVEEYRNGVKVGSSMREMTFVILDNCNNDAPTSPVSNITNANIDLDGAGNLYLSACEGQTSDISFDIHSIDPNSDNVYVSYENLPAGATITLSNDSTSHPDLHFNWNLTDATPGSYIFYVTYLDDGCPLASRKTIAYTIRVIPHAIKFADSTLGACKNAADGKAWVVPVGETTIDYNYRWEDIDGNVLRDIQSTNGDSLINIPVGTYKVYIRNAGGCGHNVVIEVTELPLPNIALQSDTAVCEGLPIRLSTTVQTGVNYIWNTGDSVCCIIARTTGTYILQAINHCGFVADSTHVNFVPCNYCFFVPNAFTPNNDGSNDKFVILPTCLFDKFSIQIFNRWGQLVFKSVSPYTSWDGTFKGKLSDLGTYFYEIEATLQDKSKAPVKLKGDIALIR